MTERRTSSALPIVLLVAVTSAVFFQVVRFPFVNWDDHEMVARNPGLLNPSWAAVGRFWSEPYLGLYTPLAYTLWSGVAIIARADAPDAVHPSLSPHAFHTLNLLLHVINVVLVFLILRTLWSRTSDEPQDRSVWPAFAGALVFAIHPLQVEPVAWVSGMNNLLGGTFSLAATALCLCWLRDVRKTSLAIAATVAFVLALFSKPTAVIVPFIALILATAVVRASRKHLMLPAAWMLLAAVFAVVTMLVQPAANIARPPLHLRPLVAADALGFYVRSLVLPLRLCIDYGRTPQWLIDHGPLAWSWTIPATLLIVAVLLRKRWPWLLAGAAVFAVALTPVLGLVPFDFQQYSTVADRYVYLAMLGPAVVLAGIFGLIAHRPAAVAAAGLIAVAMAVASVQTLRCWSDDQKLFARALEVNPRSALSNNVLGFLAAARNDPDEAERRYRLALDIQPRLFSAHYNLANLMLRGQRFDQAVEEYRAAIASAPSGDTRVAGMYNNLGVALAKLQRYDEAADAMSKVLDFAPDNADAQRNLQLVRSLRDAAATSRPSAK